MAVNGAVATKRVDDNPERGKIKKMKGEKMQPTEIGNEMASCRGCGGEEIQVSWAIVHVRHHRAKTAMSCPGKIMLDKNQ